MISFKCVNSFLYAERERERVVYYFYTENLQSHTCTHIYIVVTFYTYEFAVMNLCTVHINLYYFRTFTQEYFSLMQI